MQLGVTGRERVFPLQQTGPFGRQGAAPDLPGSLLPGHVYVSVWVVQLEVMIGCVRLIHGLRAETRFSIWPLGGAEDYTLCL